MVRKLLVEWNAHLTERRRLHALEKTLPPIAARSLAGIATKLSISDDLAHISQLVSQGEADIALLTDKIELVHGPGCPVCVTPLDTIDKALVAFD